MPSFLVLLALVFVPLLAVAAIRWQRPLLMSLPFLVTLNGITFGAAGVSVHLDQIAACLLVVPLVSSVLLGVRRFRVDATMWWLAAILGLNLLVSALYSPAKSYSLTQCVNLASVWLIYVLVFNFLESRDDLEVFLRRALWAAIVASAIGILAYVGAVIGVDIGGAEVSAAAAERFTKAYGAYGTMVEPNILGSFSAAYLVVAVALLMAATRGVASTAEMGFLRLAAGLTALALALTFTRGAWIGAAAGLICAILGARAVAKRFPLMRIAATLGVGATLAMVMLMLPGTAGDLFRFKLANLVNLQSQTAVVRLVTYGMALEQTVEHPMIGWGTFTFAPLVAQGSDFQQFDNWRNLWIGNYLLLAVHDTGIVGLTLWIGMLGAMVSRAFGAVRALRLTDPTMASRILALGAAVVTLLLSFLATSGFSLGYCWLIMGLMAAYRRVALEQPPTAQHSDA